MASSLHNINSEIQGENLKDIFLPFLIRMVYLEEELSLHQLGIDCYVHVIEKLHHQMTEG